MSEEKDIREDLTPCYEDYAHAGFMKAWNEKPFKEIVNIQTGRLDSNNADYNGKYPFFTCSPMPLKINEYAFDCEAVLLAGNNANGVFHVNKYCGQFNAYQRTYVITAKNTEELDIKFLFYRLKTIGDLLNSQSQGTATKFLTMKILNDLSFPLPSVYEQRAISSILGTLDDKIELNRRMNETLESIARAIFTSWFINFDPVRAKAENRQPEGMDAATAALFPSEFETVEGQEIPKGWRISHLSEIYSIFDSKRIPLSGKERENRKGIYPYYGAASVMDFIDEYIFDGIYVLLAEDGSVINEDNSPVLQYVWGKFWVNNHAHILQGKADISTELLMQFLQSIDIHPYVTGAVQLKVSQQNLAKIPIVLPPKEICQKYSSFIQPLYVKYRYNKENSHHLSSIRDTLLPKLLSGELPIDNPEQFTGVS